MTLPEFGTANLLEILWTLFGVIGLSQYAYGWWDVEQDRTAIRDTGGDGGLHELVISDYETAVFGFVIMLLFTAAGVLSMLAPSPRPVSQLNVLTRVAVPLAFFLAEVLFIVKKVLNIRRRRHQRRLVALREARRTNGSRLP